MSGAHYRRATKNHPVRVDHTDGSVTMGFVPVPMGMDFHGTVIQAESFMAFETSDGEITLMNVAAIKRITSLVDEEQQRREKEEREAARERARQAEEEAIRRAAAEEADAAERERMLRQSKSFTAEQYDALETLGLKSNATKADISVSYRKLVKLYHPDRLRGLGVSQKKIDFAAERLAEINNAYQVLMKAAKFAA